MQNAYNKHVSFWFFMNDVNITNRISQSCLFPKIALFWELYCHIYNLFYVYGTIIYDFFFIRSPLSINPNQQYCCEHLKLLWAFCQMTILFLFGLRKMKIKMNNQHKGTIPCFIELWHKGTIPCFIELWAQTMLTDNIFIDFVSVSSTNLFLQEVAMCSPI